MAGSSELSEFLKSPRTRLRPEDVGLRDYGGLRRVAGLRREEPARLTGVSIAHCTRLEQGKGETVSDEVLDAVGSALRPDADERAYLRGIARTPRACAALVAPEVTEGSRHLLEPFVMTPALVMGGHTETVGWNRLAAARADPVRRARRAFVRRARPVRRRAGFGVRAGAAEARGRPGTATEEHG